MRNSTDNRWPTHVLLFCAGSWLFLFPLRLAELRLVDLVLFASAFLLVLNRRYLKARVDRNVLVLVIFLLCGMVAQPSNILLLLRLTFVLFLYYQACFYFSDVHKIFLFRILLVALVFHVFLGFLQYYYSFYYFDEYGEVFFGKIGRARGFLENSVFFASFLSVVGLASVIYVRFPKNKALVFFVITLGLFLTGTRGALVAFICGLAVFFFNRRWVYRVVVFLCFFTPLLFSYFIFYPEASIEINASGYCFNMQPEKYFDKSYGMRLEKLNFSLNKIMEGGFWGSGFGKCIGGGADLLFSRLINDFGLIGFFIWIFLFRWLNLVVSREMQAICSCFSILSLTFDVLYSYISIMSFMCSILLFYKKKAYDG